MQKRDPNGPVVALFDVDGTLIHRDPTSKVIGMVPSRRVLDALQEFSRRDGIAIVSTGRCRYGIRELLDAAPFRGCVTMDGAYVELDGDAVVDKFIPPEDIPAIVEEMRRLGMSAMLEGTEAWVELSWDGSKIYGSAPVARSFDELRALKPDLVFGKIDFKAVHHQSFSQSELLSGMLTHYVVNAEEHEAVMPGVSKGSGARALIDALERRIGAAPSCVYAFGDSTNDLSLFEVVDVAVAMGQSPEAVCAAADYVTDSCADDGVATGLEHFGLI